MTPRSCTSRRIAASTSSAPVGSIADVGSSSTSTRGCAVSAAPIAARCSFAAGELTERACAQRREPEQVERFLDALAHHRRLDRELLHDVRELFLDGVGGAAGERILLHDADDVGELARRELAGVAPVDEHAARGARRR